MTEPGMFTERMWSPDRWGYTVMGVRMTNYRTIPPTVWLGRDPAPWCPRPWSKSRRWFEVKENEDGSWRVMRALFSVSDWDIIDEKQRRMGCWT